jgi:hypothetical protein
MKKWLKKWLGITEIEKELNSTEAFALMKYASTEVSRTRNVISQAIFDGKIKHVDQLYYSNYVSYQIEYQGEIINLSKYYKFATDEYEYTATMNYVVFTGKEAQEYYELADKCYKHKGGIDATGI